MGELNWRAQCNLPSDLASVGFVRNEISSPLGIDWIYESSFVRL